MKLAPVPEKDIQRAVLDYLLMRGHLAFKPGSGAFRMSYQGRDRFVRMGPKGCSDIIGAEKGTGKFFAVEVKSRDGRLTEDQKEFLERVKACGGLPVLAYGLDDVIAVGL